MTITIGSQVELISKNGEIPGIPPGNYWVVDIQNVNEIAIALTQGGPPLVPTGTITGNHQFIEKATDLAFPLEGNEWLNLNLTEFLDLTLDEFLETELGNIS